ncbi:MAG: penicillin-insensitive murein endopeptidase [Hyphomicrobiaceae bacterium]
MKIRGTIALLPLLVTVSSGTAAPEVDVPPVPQAKPMPAEKRLQRLPPTSAKVLFKAVTTGAALRPATYGFYNRGCLSGGEQLPVDGPSWQAMRLSRNRHWAHPITIKVVKRLAVDAQRFDDWPGLLVGDLSMPRGGPMPPAHASHQVGLDADIWLTPMPKRRLTRRERENKSATFMLTKTHLAVNRAVWTTSHAKLIKRAASYREVQRILVHPAIKKELCDSAGADRGWLQKVRPVRGHNYHFHIRLRCPPGSPGCKSQREPKADDGCGTELDQWYKKLRARLKPKPKTRSIPRKPRKKRPPLTLADLPRACRAVLNANARLVIPSPIPASRP